MSDELDYDDLSVDELLEERAVLLDDLSAIETAIANAIQGETCPSDDEDDDD
jgi:hypothetical protein